LYVLTLKEPQPAWPAFCRNALCGSWLCRHKSQTISAHWQQPMHGCVGSYWSETQQPSVFSYDSFIRFPGWHRPTGFGEMAEALPPNVFSCGGWTALGCGAGRGAGGSLPVEHPQHIFFQVTMPERLFIRTVASGNGQVPAPFLPRHRVASGFG
jgi:hypothetical protein